MVLVVALVGIGVNLAATWQLAGANRETLNVEGSYQHVLNDLFAFIATAIAGAVILATGWVRADAVAALIVAGLMLRASWRLLRDSGRVLLDIAPAGLPVQEIGTAMASHPGVVEVHDLHVWEVTTEFPTLSAHVLVEPGADCHGIRRELEALLHDRFGLGHTTLQVEHVPAKLVQIREGGLRGDDSTAADVRSACRRVRAGPSGVAGGGGAVARPRRCGARRRARSRHRQAHPGGGRARGAGRGGGAGSADARRAARARARGSRGLGRGDPVRRRGGGRGRGRLEPPLVRARAALPEIHRVLRARGRFGFGWNHRDDRHPAVARLGATVHAAQARGPGPRWRRRDWAAELAATGLFRDVERAQFEHVHELQREALGDHLLSYSGVAALPEDERRRVLAAVAGLLDADESVSGGGRLRLPFVVTAYRATRVT